MKANFWWWGLGCLAVAIGLGLAWQRLQLRPLRAELAVLRDQQQEIGRLRAEQAKLQASQIPEAELQRLRADREAIGQMRQEITGLRTKLQSKAQALAAPAPTQERFGMGVEMIASEWRNAGGASPAAALETVLWAAAGGDVDAFAKRIRLDTQARTAALELLQSLPPAERAKHASPEALMAYLSIKDVPVGKALVSTWSGQSDVTRSASVTLSAPGQQARRVMLVFVRDGAEWKLRATETAVAKYAAALRGEPEKVAGAK